jgi:small subunit ribosomal protein S1
MTHDDDAADDFATLFAQAEQAAPKAARRGVKVGDTVKGRIVSVGSTGAFIDMGVGKSEALLPLDEVRDAQGEFIVKVGDEVSARVVELYGKDGCVVLRRSMTRGAVSSGELEQAAQLGLAVEGTVTAVNKGGVDVLVAGVRGFCPISQLELRHVEDANEYIGQKLNFRITKYESDNRGANMVLSRRALLEEVRRESAVATRAKLEPGAVMRGTVSSLRDFGAFIDLGGIDGLLPASEISYKRGIKPSEVLSVGQQIEVQVLRIEKTEDPKRPEKISLSLKALAVDPWQEAIERFGPGSKLQGKVMRIESFGAFIELVPGVEGLAHISELAGGRQARHAREVVKPGDTVEVTVLSVDRETRRIALGTGEREEEVGAEDLAAARRASTTSLGTFADLLNGRKGR